MAKSNTGMHSPAAEGSREAVGTAPVRALEDAVDKRLHACNGILIRKQCKRAHPRADVLVEWVRVRDCGCLQTSHELWKTRVSDEITN